MSKPRVVRHHWDAGANTATRLDRQARAEDKHTAHWLESAMDSADGSRGP